MLRRALKLQLIITACVPLLSLHNNKQHCIATVLANTTSIVKSFVKRLQCFDLLKLNHSLAHDKVGIRRGKSKGKTRVLELGWSQFYLPLMSRQSQYETHTQC